MISEEQAGYNGKNDDGANTQKFSEFSPHLSVVMFRLLLKEIGGFSQFDERSEASTDSDFQENRVLFMSMPSV